MGGKINIYNLGEAGVDVVKSPLHGADGDLFKAQNATTDPDGVLGGIRKRDGMAKVGDQLTGAIEGASNIPLPAISTRTFYLGCLEDASHDPWRSSVGGSSWTSSATPSQADNVWQGIGQETFYNVSPMLSYRGKMYFSGESGSNIRTPIRSWDGTVDQVVALLFPYDGVRAAPSTPVFVRGNFWLHRGKLHYISEALNNVGVYRLDLLTGLVEFVGADGFWFDNAPTNDATPNFGLSYLDRVWVGGYGGYEDPITHAFGNVGLLAWIRNGETTWTQERKGTGLSNNFCYSHGAVYKGDLYMGTRASSFSGVGAIIERRDAATGAWTTSNTGTGSGTNYWTCFVVFNNLLFAVFHEIFGSGGSVSKSEVWKFDGTTWTLDLDVIAAGYPALRFGGVLVEANALWLATSGYSYSTGYVLKRTIGGAWSQPTSNVLHTMGNLGFVP